MPLRLLVFLAVCAVLSGNASASDLAPSPTPAPSPSSAASAPPSPAVSGSPSAQTVDPKITARAKEWAHRVAVDNIDRSQLTPEMNAALTDALAKQVAGEVGPLGEPTTFTFVTTRSSSTGTLYVYHVGFKSTTLDWIFVLDPNGKISGMLFRPPSGTS